MKAASLKVLMICALTFAAFSCTKEDVSIEDQLIGKWTLTERTVGNVPDTLSECEMTSRIELQLNNACLLVDGCTGDTTHSGWNYKYEMLNISYLLPAAFYIEQLDNAALKIKRNDISSSGELQITILSYTKTQ